MPLLVEGLERRALLPFPEREPALDLAVAAALLSSAVDVPLAGVEFRTPSVTVINATDATPYADADDMRQRLASQVYRRVHWVDTIHAILDGGATKIIECGPGKVLSGLVRRISRGTTVKSIDSMAGLEKALQD